MYDPRKLPLHYRQLSSAARELDRSRLALLPRFLTLFGPGRFRASEIFRLGLLGMAPGDWNEFISKERMTRIQKRLNPREFAVRANDKAVFHRFCDDAGLPTPGLVVELDSNDRAQARSRLAALAEGEIVIKPSLGYQGQGVLLLNHRDGWFASLDGEKHSIDDLVARLDQNTEFDRWLVQPRVTNHRAVLAISPSNALQTLRIVTFVDDAGQAHIVASQWRLARADSLTDNFHGGANGNLLCNVDVDEGRIIAALRLASGGTGMEELARHPTSGVTFAGLDIPLWSEAAALARRAALLMLPMRSIGWDIGLTPTGPMIIEANERWDPQNADGEMGKRLRFMAARTTLFRFTGISWSQFVFRRDRPG